MTALPAALALRNIADGASIVASDHRNNNSDIQTGVNGLVTALSGGTAGQLMIASSSSAVAWGVPHSGRLSLSGAQSIGSASFTTVTLDTGNGSFAGMTQDTVNHKLVAIQAGVYLFTVETGWAANATGDRALDLQRYNSANALQSHHYIEDLATNLNNLGIGAQGRTFIDAFAASDYLLLQAYQSSGGNLNLSSAVVTAVRIG